MAFKTAFSDKRILILDDMAEMRSALRSQIGSLGCENVSLSANVQDAMGQLNARAFDIILCDFYLGSGADGQQFLEFLRTRKLISHSALFLMITAEKRYETVVTTAECLPDDYLLKPFTAHALTVRLERLLEKKARLAQVDLLQDQDNWPGVISACDDIIATRDRYLFDAMRIKGQALLAAQRFADALIHYQQIIEVRPLPWARLGLARALRHSGETARSKETLTALITEAPQLMAAYDLLGELHAAAGEHHEALAVLDSASLVSPNSLTRNRAIAAVAERQGDYARVEQALARVVSRTRHSPLRESGDYARLGHALTELGEPAKAVSLLEEARGVFKDDPNNLRLAAAEAVAQHLAGNPEKSAQALARAAQNDAASQSEELVLVLARAHLVTGRQDSAQAMLKYLVQSHPEAKELHGRISTLLRDGGAPELAEQLVGQSIREIVLLNNEAVRRAQAGELGPAAQMLSEAARRLPGNLQIVANAAAALFYDIFQNGLEEEKLRTAQAFVQAVQTGNPAHPKLVDLAEMMSRIRTKFGLSSKP